MPGSPSRAPPVEELIGDIYQAALRPELWSSFLTHLHAAVPDSFLLLGIIDRHAANSRSLAMCGLAEQAIHDYRSHYIGVNPWIEALWVAPLGQPVPVRTLVDDAAVQDGEFFRDWLRHQPAHYPTSLLVPLEDGRKLCLTVVHRPTASTGDAGPGDAILRALTPHLTRAMQVGAWQQQASLRHAADPAVLDMLSTGVIYTDRNGRVVMVNTSAEAMLRARIGLRCGPDGRLSAERLSDTERLRAAILGAASPMAGGGASSGGCLTLPTGEDAQRLAVLVAPLPSVIAAPDGAARTVVFVNDRAPASRLHPATLAAALDLTPTEAVVIASIARGLNLPEIASGRGVSLGTVRGQVKSAMTKTGTHSMAGLVRLAMQCSFPVR